MSKSHNLTPLVQGDVRTLSRQAIDWLIAQLEDQPVQFDGVDLRYGPGQFSDEGIYSPSSDPMLGHELIEREKIQLRHVNSPGHTFHGLWMAQDCLFRPTNKSVDWVPFGKSYAKLEKGYLTGPTALIAALRFHIAKQKGLVVEIPECMSQLPPA